MTLRTISRTGCNNSELTLEGDDRWSRPDRRQPSIQYWDWASSPAIGYGLDEVAQAFVLARCLMREANVQACSILDTKPLRCIEMLLAVGLHRELSCMAQAKLHNDFHRFTQEVVAAKSKLLRTGSSSGSRHMEHVAGSDRRLPAAGLK